eukprot:6286171-Karenia_brevis.AAC.1
MTDAHAVFMQESEKAQFIGASCSLPAEQLADSQHTSVAYFALNDDCVPVRSSAPCGILGSM